MFTVFPNPAPSVPRYQLIKSGLAVNASGVYFTVAGGRVRILELSLRVSTVIGAGATTLALNANAAVDTPLSIASAALANAPVDSTLMLLGDPVVALFLATGTGGAQGPTLSVTLNPCTIDSVIVGGTTGALTGYVLWEPIDPGATLT